MSLDLVNRGGCSSHRSLVPSGKGRRPAPGRIQAPINQLIGSETSACLRTRQGIFFRGKRCALVGKEPSLALTLGINPSGPRGITGIRTVTVASQTLPMTGAARMPATSRRTSLNPIPMELKPLLSSTFPFFSQLSIIRLTLSYVRAQIALQRFLDRLVIPVGIFVGQRPLQRTINQRVGQTLSSRSHSFTRKNIK